MGELHRFQPRADSPARHALSVAETWALLAEALRASSSLAERAAAAIEAGASPTECFAAVAQLTVLPARSRALRAASRDRASRSSRPREEACNSAVLRRGR
jgi:hypothetical protein